MTKAFVSPRSLARCKGEAPKATTWQKTIVQTHMANAAMTKIVQRGLAGMDRCDSSDRHDLASQRAWRDAKNRHCMRHSVAVS